MIGSLPIIAFSVVVILLNGVSRLRATQPIIQNLALRLRFDNRRPHLQFVIRQGLAKQPLSRSIPCYGVAFTFARVDADKDVDVFMRGGVSQRNPLFSGYILYL